LSRSGNRPLRIVVAAEEAAGVQVLRGLAAHRDRPEIVAVLTTAEEGHKRRPLAYEAAVALGLETWPAGSAREPELGVRLRRAQVDLLLNVHSLFLMHRDVVEAPRIGSFNLHPGPLPEYAGLNAPSWAIYNGETTHAVTLHWMDSGIDTGPIAYTRSFELADDATGLAVSGACVRLGVPLVLRLAGQAARDPAGIPRIGQDLARRRYFGKGPPNEGRLDWSLPATEIVRFVRAADYGPFPPPWGYPETELCGRRVGIVKAALTGVPCREPPGTVREVTDAGAVVAGGDESILVQRIFVDGRSLKPADSYVRTRLGATSTAGPSAP
jgi:methionyl-tRNA formyltransferase